MKPDLQGCWLSCVIYWIHYWKREAEWLSVGVWLLKQVIVWLTVSCGWLPGPASRKRIILCVAGPGKGQHSKSEVLNESLLHHHKAENCESNHGKLGPAVYYRTKLETCSIWNLREVVVLRHDKYPKCCITVHFKWFTCYVNFTSILQKERELPAKYLHKKATSGSDLLGLEKNDMSPQNSWHRT